MRYRRCVPLLGVKTPSDAGFFLRRRRRETHPSNPCRNPYYFRNLIEGNPLTHYVGRPAGQRLSPVHDLEHVALEVDLTGDVGPGQPELSRRPHQPSQGLRLSYDDRIFGGGSQLRPVPESNRQSFGVPDQGINQRCNFICNGLRQASTSLDACTISNGRNSALYSA